MNDSKIEWVLNPDNKTLGKTQNPVTGCSNGCPYCYARRLANGRLKQRYLRNRNIAPIKGKANLSGDIYLDPISDPFYPRFWPERMEGLAKRNARIHKKGFLIEPMGVFIVDMGDLFGIGIPGKWTSEVLDLIRDNGYDRFYLLTKQPQNLIKFSPFPDNCWVGVTATNVESLNNACHYLGMIEAKVRYISFEPLLARIGLTWFMTGKVDWVIIGACTGTLNDLKLMLVKYPDLTLMPYGKRWTLQPKLEWVREIVEACDKAGVKVFLKDNLKPLLIPEDCRRPNSLMDNIFWSSEKATLRQELPEEVK